MKKTIGETKYNMAMILSIRFYILMNDPQKLPPIINIINPTISLEIPSDLLRLYLFLVKMNIPVIIK